MSAIAYFNGAFVPKDEIFISPDDRGFLFGDGVYEVARSYDGRIFALEPHLDRMRYGLGEMAIHGVDVPALAEVAHELIARNGLGAGGATVYFQVTRGAAPRTHAFPDPPVVPTVYAAAAPFTPKDDPAIGVAAITVPDTRWARCDIKSIQLIPNCLANQRARSSGAREGIFVRDGVVLEGSHTSVFFVLDGEVRTAPKNNYILPGITRDVVLELCGSAGIPVREAPVFIEQAARASEVFLVGTTVEVTPVIRLDGTPVGGEKAGPIARELLQLLREKTG